MKKRSRLGMLGAGFAMALGALTGTAQATQPLNQAIQQAAQGGQGELKGTVERKRASKAIEVNNYGGLDFGPMFAHSLPSPIWYGKSCRGKHTNKQRCKHNAKLKRRKSA